MSRNMISLILAATVLFVLTACGTNDDIITLQAVTNPITESQLEPDTTPEPNYTYQEEDCVEVPEEILTLYQYCGAELGEFLTSYQYCDVEEINLVSGHQVAEEFLSGFLSLFSSNVGWKDIETGNFHVLDREPWQWIEPEDTPMVYMGGVSAEWGGEFIFNGDFYDRDGNLITEMPFILFLDTPYAYVNPAKADSFSMFDLDGNGIPEIVVDFISWQSSGFGFSVNSVLYRFIDGAYREIGSFDRAHSFFTDPNGEIIIFFDNMYSGVLGYYYLRFTDDGIELESVLPEMWWELSDNIWQEWHEHHMWPYFHLENEVTMFITGTQLVKIPALTDMQDQIVTSIRQSHAEANNAPNITIPVFEIRQELLGGFSVTNFVSSEWAAVWPIYNVNANATFRAHEYVEAAIFRLPQIPSQWGTPMESPEWAESEPLCPASGIWPGNIIPAGFTHTLEPGVYVVMIRPPYGYDDHFFIVVGD